MNPRKKKARVKLGLSKQSIPDKIHFVRDVAAALTNNAHFPSPPVSPKDAVKAADALESAHKAARDARIQAVLRTALRDDAARANDVIADQLGSYVQMVSKGDETVILSAGMKVMGAKSSPQTMFAPEGFLAVPGKVAGTVAVRWDGVPGAKSYHVECALDPSDAAVWTACGKPTKRSFTVTGLVSGKRMWFRVVAIGAAGQGPWSDPATCYVG